MRVPPPPSNLHVLEEDENLPKVTDYKTSIGRRWSRAKLIKQNRLAHDAQCTGRRSLFDLFVVLFFTLSFCHFRCVEICDKYDTYYV